MLPSAGPHDLRIYPRYGEIQEVASATYVRLDNPRATRTLSYTVDGQTVVRDVNREELDYLRVDGSPLMTLLGE